MLVRFFLLPAALLLAFYPIHADTVSRRAAITGGGGPGRCTIEVNVDHEAQIEIFGDTANLRTLAGQPAFWRRFECNAPLPGRPHDFHLARINGRGHVRVLKDPSSNRGTAVVHILDPKAGRGVYSLDVAWRANTGGWVPPQGPGPGPVPNVPRFAIERCQNAVGQWLNRDGYRVVSFGRVVPDRGPGPHGWISGIVNGKRGIENRRFSFSCAVDLRAGEVKYVDVRRHDRGSNFPGWSYQ
jgi:hypothetical protein